MPKQGTVVRWNAERAFGFIRSPASAADVFFHIRDYRGTTPPREGLAVVFEKIHGGGKGPRAMAVQAAGAQSAPSGHRGSEARRARRSGTTRTGRSSGDTATAAGAAHTRRNPAPAVPTGASLAYGLMLAWAALVVWAVWTHLLPLWTVAALAGLNLVTLWLYAADKNAARRGQWRIAEKQLHLLSLLGGWPAAWLAQQNMRHKSSKTAFRAIYWATIVLHCAALAGFLHWLGAFNPEFPLGPGMAASEPRCGPSSTEAAPDRKPGVQPLALTSQGGKVLRLRYQ